jgi:hypothetical protein
LQLSVIALAFSATSQEILQISKVYRTRSGNPNNKNILNQTKGSQRLYLHKPARTTLAPSVELGSVQRVAMNQGITAFPLLVVADIRRINIVGRQTQKHVSNLMVS